MGYDPKPGGKGGMVFRCAGEVGESAKMKVDEKTGELKCGFSVEWWGGNAWVRLDHPEDGRFVKGGCWVECEMETREFNGNQYAGKGWLVAIDGKPIDQIREEANKASQRKAG